MGFITSIGWPIFLMKGTDFLMDYSIGRAPLLPSGCSILAIIQHCFFHRRSLEIFLAMHLIYYSLKIFTALETRDWSLLKPRPLRHMVSRSVKRTCIFWVFAAVLVALESHGLTPEALFCRFAEYAIAWLEEAKSTHSAAPLGGGGGFNVSNLA